MSTPSLSGTLASSLGKPRSQARYALLRHILGIQATHDQLFEGLAHLCRDRARRSNVNEWDTDYHMVRSLVSDVIYDARPAQALATCHALDYLVRRFDAHEINLPVRDVIIRHFAAAPPAPTPEQPHA